MIRLSRDQRVYDFSPTHLPTVCVRPGETLVFETEDAGSHRIQTPEDAMRYVARPDYTNPTTGPVYVEGAAPGDTLAVHILSIEPERQGYTRLSQEAGLLRDAVTAPAAQIWSISGQEGTYHASWGNLRLPCRPMIGTIGTAPAAGSIENWAPGPHGGNMDVPAVCAGATLYLPVRVDGGLLALGDVHAHQGDGEITNVALEVRALVTLRLELLKGRQWERPWLENDRAWVTMADAPDARLAMETAAQDMLALLMQELSLSSQDAMMFIGIAGEMRPGQSSYTPGVPVTYYLTVPRPAIQVS